MAELICSISRETGHGMHRECVRSHERRSGEARPETSTWGRLDWCQCLNGITPTPPPPRPNHPVLQFGRPLPHHPHVHVRESGSTIMLGLRCMDLLLTAVGIVGVGECIYSSYRDSVSHNLSCPIFPSSRGQIRRVYCSSGSATGSLRADGAL